MKSKIADKLAQQFYSAECPHHEGDARRDASDCAECTYCFAQAVAEETREEWAKWCDSKAKYLSTGAGGQSVNVQAANCNKAIAFREVASYLREGNL